MKKPQWITIAVAILLTTGLYFFGRTIPRHSIPDAKLKIEEDRNHLTQTSVNIDTILAFAKKQMSPGQLQTLSALEEKQRQSANAGTEEQAHVLHQLAGFWRDSLGIFEPFAWYLGEAARLENSEKNLTFAAHLFLENLQQDEVIRRKQWKALEAKDLFERSLKINPGNDSAKVGLGAAYLFGELSSTPMEGILKVREVAERDSTNVYAQMTLAKASLLSGQYDKAISRLMTITRLKPRDLDASLLLAEVYERMNKKDEAVTWYRKSLELAGVETTSNVAELKSEIQKRIEQLKK